MCKRHPHADVIIAWAEGKTIQQLVNGKWIDVLVDDPMFRNGMTFRIKPEPVEVITCNGVVITPLKEKPKCGDTYYIVTLTRDELYIREMWNNDSRDNLFFTRGLAHSTAMSALAHATAMLKTKKELQDV